MAGTAGTEKFQSNKLSHFVDFTKVQVLAGTAGTEKFQSNKLSHFVDFTQVQVLAGTANGLPEGEGGVVERPFMHRLINLT